VTAGAPAGGGGGAPPPPPLPWSPAAAAGTARAVSAASTRNLPRTRL